MSSGLLLTSDEERRRETLARQGEAADPQRSAWVSANAGTGKTKVLTDRVIRLLLAGTQPEKILCLTFTKTAAAEMANRLFERLGRWTALDNVTLLKELRELEGVDIDADQLNPARRLFARALETPGGLKIQTLHGFCQSVLERFPLEAGVAPGFKVLDDASARVLLRDAELALYGDAVSEPDGALGKALTRLAARYDAPAFSDLMRQVLGRKQDIAEFIIRVGGTDRLEADLRAQLGLPSAGDAGDLIEASLADIARLEPELHEAAARLGEGTATDKKNGEKLLAFLAQADRALAYEEYESLYLTGTGDPRKRLMTKKPAEAFPHVVELLTSEQGRVVDVRENLRRLVTLHMTLDVVSVGDAFIQHYESAKARRGVLDYDDLIRRTGDLVSPVGASAWVHYKLDGGIEHILVDEAQDTSPGQWRVVEALAQEFFSGASAFQERSEVSRTMFAVGDEKQSIYSFQGAEPGMFAQKRAEFRGQVEDAGLAFSELDLILSFRSTAEVLASVDAVFADPAHAQGLTATGTVPLHEADRVAEPGLVELWPAVRPEEKDDTDPWDAPLDSVSRKAPRAIVAHDIAAQIAHWLETKEPVLPGGAPIEAGDILILVQRRNTFVDEMIRALKLKGIPVAGRDRMVLTDQIAVMDLMALAEFALLPEDDLTLATVLRSPFAELSEEDLFHLSQKRSGTLWEALRARAEEPAFEKAAAFLGEVLARVEVLRPYEFFVAALGLSAAFETSGRERLLRRLGPEAGDPIDEFLSHALQFEQLEPPSLQGFLAWVRGDQAEIKRDFDHAPKEVRIMTVHGAKGLEGCIVFLPDTCALATTRSDPPLMGFGATGERGLLFGMAKDEADSLGRGVKEELRERRLEEQRRLLYVAMTRARDRLYITGYETTRERPDGCWYSLMEESLTPIMASATRFDGAPVLRLEREGDGSVEVQEAASEGAAQVASAKPSPQWINEAVSPEPPPRRFAPSQLGAALEEEVPAFSEPPVLSPLSERGQDRFKRGLAVHRLLELLPALPASSRKAAASAYLEDPARGFDAEQAALIASEVMAVLEDAAFAAIFAEGSIAEAPVAGVLPGTDIHLNGSIDRLVITDKEILIVDYKTNRPPPVQVEELAPVYVMQMAAYRGLLAALLPGRPVRAALLWTDGPRLMEIPSTLMDDALAQIG